MSEIIHDSFSYDICKKSISAIKDSSLSLAIILAYIDFNKIYEIGKYKNTADFARKEYGISKVTVSRLLTVVRTFGRKVENSDNIQNLDISYFDSLAQTFPEGLMEIKPEYRDYEYTKLSIMSQLNEEHMKMVNKDLSVRQLSQILQAQKQKEQLEDKKKSLDTFEIQADPFWYDNSNIERLFKIGRNQVRAPNQLKLLDKLFKSDEYFDYTEKQKISIFATLAIKEKIERLEKEN